MFICPVINIIVGLLVYYIQRTLYIYMLPPSLMALFVGASLERCEDTGREGGSKGHLEIFPQQKCESQRVRLEEVTCRHWAFCSLTFGCLQIRTSCLHLSDSFLLTLTACLAAFSPFCPLTKFAGNCSFVQIFEILIRYCNSGNNYY